MKLLELCVEDDQRGTAVRQPVDGREGANASAQTMWPHSHTAGGKKLLHATTNASRAASASRTASSLEAGRVPASPPVASWGSRRLQRRRGQGLAGRSASTIRPSRDSSPKRLPDPHLTSSSCQAATQQRVLAREALDQLSSDGGSHATSTSSLRSVLVAPAASACGASLQLSRSLASNMLRTAGERRQMSLERCEVRRALRHSLTSCDPLRGPSPGTAAVESDILKALLLRER